MCRCVEFYVNIEMLWTGGSMSRLGFTYCMSKKLWKIGLEWKEKSWKIGLDWI